MPYLTAAFVKDMFKTKPVFNCSKLTVEKPE